MDARITRSCRTEEGGTPVVITAADLLDVTRMLHQMTTLLVAMYVWVGTTGQPILRPVTDMVPGPSETGKESPRTEEKAPLLSH